MAKVSIVMPVYNGEQYLAEALDSILDQTLRDWELIAINEYGSNAKTTMLLSEYADKDSRIRVIQNSKRLFISESLNIGLRASRGQYIARMDADDIAEPDRLKLQAEFMDNHPEIDICGCAVEMFGEDTWNWRVYSDPQELNCACLFYTPFIHPTVIMRADTLKEHGLEYDPAIHFTEDYDFFVRASEYLRFSNIQKKLYRYRFTKQNATNIGGTKGINLQNDVMRRHFASFGMAFSSEEVRLLSPNSYPIAGSVEDALMDLEKLDLLLKKVFVNRRIQEKYGPDILFSVLHRRWMDAYEKLRWSERLSRDGRVQAAVERGLFYHSHFYHRAGRSQSGDSPRVSVVLPTFNSEKYILDTIYSLLEQDYSDYEILVVNEFGSDDATLSYIALFDDSRIRIIQNSEKLGLAESLNSGIRQARGCYIARADADDLYPKDRLEKQVAFMDSHPDIAVCGSWQRHFGLRNSIHQPPTSPEEMKASLLFKCDVCHSTVILRKAVFTENNLWYDSRYLSEDFELWSRTVRDFKFATIPEVLGEYRWNGDNITTEKMDRLDEEAQRIVARSLKENLGIEVAEEDLILLSGWKNPFFDSRYYKENLKIREDALLNRIEEQNSVIQAYDASALKKTLDARRRWAGISTGNSEESAENRILSSGSAAGRSENLKKNGVRYMIRTSFRKILKRIYRPFRMRYEDRLIEMQETVWRLEGEVQYLQKTLNDLDGHLYDYHEKLNRAIEESVSTAAERLCSEYRLQSEETKQQVSDCLKDEAHLPVSHGSAEIHEKGKHHVR